MARSAMAPSGTRPPTRSCAAIPIATKSCKHPISGKAWTIDTLRHALRIRIHRRCNIATTHYRRSTHSGPHLIESQPRGRTDAAAPSVRRAETFGEQGLLRHASSRVTMDTYTQAVTAQKRKAKSGAIRLFRVRAMGRRCRLTSRQINYFFSRDFLRNRASMALPCSFQIRVYEQRFYPNHRADFWPPASRPCLDYRRTKGL